MYRNNFDDVERKDAQFPKCRMSFHETTKRIGNMTHSVREGSEELKWEVEFSFFDLREWGSRD